MKLKFVSVTESQAQAPAIIQKEQFNNQQIFFWSCGAALFLAAPAHPFKNFTAPAPGQFQKAINKKFVGT